LTEIEDFHRIQWRSLTEEAGQVVLKEAQRSHSAKTIEFAASKKPVTKPVKQRGTQEMPSNAMEEARRL
jgi:hypothetical protein